MKLSNRLIFIFLLIPTLLLSIIKESNDLNIILKEYKDGDFVMLDLDLTLIMPKKGYLGSDPWFGYLITEYDNDLNLALPDYYLAEFHVWMKPAGPETKKVISTLKNKKVPTIGFTARSLGLATQTQMQLKKCSLCLGFGGAPTKNMSLFAHKNGAASIYRDGILFCGPNDKNDILPQFLSRIKKPKRIIFADDKMKNISAVEKAVEKLGIEFLGIRYSRCDQYVKSFDAQAKKKTQEEFKKLKAKLMS